MNYDTMDAAGQVKHALLNGLAALRESQPAQPANPVGGTLSATASATASSTGPVMTWLDVVSGTGLPADVAPQMSTSFSPALDPLTAGGESTTPASLAAPATEDHTDTSDASARTGRLSITMNQTSSLPLVPGVQHNLVFDELFQGLADPMVGQGGWESQGEDQMAAITSNHGKCHSNSTVAFI